MTARSLYFGETKQGNLHEQDYTLFIRRVVARFQNNTQGKPVFTTDVDQAKLWQSYLDAFPEDQRQHLNCNTCRHFIQRFGGLVTITDQGTPVSAVFNVEDARQYHMDYSAAWAFMKGFVESSRVTGIFLSSEQTLGQPVTGIWQHIHVINPAIFTSRLMTAGQTMAERRVIFGSLKRATTEYNIQTVNTALQLLEANALYRSEKVLGVAHWFKNLLEKLDGTTGRQRENILWREFATAPAGFANVRSSMIGTLLDDIQAGMDFQAVSSRFATKMDPSNYRRTVGTPSVGQINAAERAVEALGIAPAFQRRFTVLDDLRSGVLWFPGEVTQEKPVTVKTDGGIFGDLKPKGTVVPELDIPAKKITWEKFSRDVLPGAVKIEYAAALQGPYSFLTTAADANAPNIVQWGTGVSWSFPNPPARADEWNLKAGELVPVDLIVKSPNLWTNEKSPHGNGVFLLLKGAKDTRGLPGGGLFTEHLRDDLKPYRATIQAHLNRLAINGADDPNTAAFGIGLFAGQEFLQLSAPKLTVKKDSDKSTLGAAPQRVHAILVVDDSGSMQSYISAARQAMAQLLSSIRAMPGKVDVTFHLFGSANRTRMLLDRAPLALTESIVEQMQARSGGTALNDCLIDAIRAARGWYDYTDPQTSFFLGIVTDGEENESRNSVMRVRDFVQEVQQTGRWTLAYAGAGRNPLQYARSIGIPEGNMTAFEASSYGFQDIGNRYVIGTSALAANYASGRMASDSFFASAQKAVGSDHPVLVVTNKSGAKGGFELDRWE
jgi:hypothetical protein